MKRIGLPILLTCLALPLLARAQAPQTIKDPEGIVARFVNGGTRQDFLKELKAAVADKSAGWYDKEFPSLISALEKEPPPPTGYDKPADKRSPDESIKAWIYDLSRSAPDPGFTPPEPNTQGAFGHLVDAGTLAMDALVAALDDDSPTRQLGWEVGPSLSVVLRRSDHALDCIQRISGITFFRRTQGRGGYFHNDAQRRSVTDNIRTWWKLAKGKSQADGLRIRLCLWKHNTTIGDTSYVEADLLFTLSQLESPEQAIGPLRRFCADDTYGLNSPITQWILQIDPQYLLRTTYDRLAANKVRDGDYAILLKYGDKKIYQELSRRAQIDNKLDPGAWTPGEQAHQAATYGKNWAIPIVAAVLSKTEITGGRTIGNITQNFSNADQAIEVFQQLTGKDFGYRIELSDADRLAAINRAHDWWIKEGQPALADKIAADHPSGTDGTDLLATDEQIAATIAHIASPDAQTARAAVASLGHVFSLRTQQALVARLAKEPDAAERLLILRKLDRPAVWQESTLAALFEKDSSMEVRASTAAALLATFDLGANIIWNRRLETHVAALAAVRRVADNAPSDLVLPTLEILMRHGTPEDVARIRALASREPARSDPRVMKYIESLKPHAAGQGN